MDSSAFTPVSERKKKYEIKEPEAKTTKDDGRGKAVVQKGKVKDLRKSFQGLVSPSTDDKDVFKDVVLRRTKSQRERDYLYMDCNLPKDYVSSRHQNQPRASRR